MKALFLAGGKGTRLQPLTDKVPKPMVQIMNKPLLERTMVNLKNCGISEIVISSCYMSRYIQDYFGDGGQLGLNIKYIVEEVPLGTGGAIKNAESMFNDTFIIFNADILSDIDIMKFVDFHKSSKVLATIAAIEVEDPSAYGAIESDSKGYIVSFIEKPKPEEILSNYINAGIYIIEPEIFAEISGDCVVSLERDVFPKILKKGHKLAVYKDSSYWADIGTLEKYMQVHKDIMGGNCRMIDCNYTGDNICIGNNVRIHPRAELVAPVYIGDNVSIGARTVVSNSVIGNNVNIGAESRITGSILWNDIKIGREVTLIGSIITSNAFVIKNKNFLNTVYSRITNSRFKIKQVIS